MRIFYLLIFTLTPWVMTAQGPRVPAIVIHGGAGAMVKGSHSETAERAIRQAMQDALEESFIVLDEGGSAMDAIKKAIAMLEDSPWFNAGRGAVMNSEGGHELDASIMDGSDLNAGAVAGVTTVRSPIMAAYEVMMHSPHVLLIGAGAEAFARSRKLEMVDNSYFTTPEVKEAWKRMQSEKAEGPRGALPEGDRDFSKLGTVGAVAIDKAGNLAAGTSTGGMMGKAWNRVGDSPIIGAGTYADNATCGVSCTGHGEYFIRLGVAKEISDQMAFGNKSLREAMNYTIAKRLTDLGGRGGVVAIDKAGNIAMDFNTPGMYRAFKNSEESRVYLYGHEND